MPAAFSVYDIPFPLSTGSGLGLGLGFGGEFADESMLLYGEFPSRHERCVTVPSVDLQWWKQRQKQQRANRRTNRHNVGGFAKVGTK